MVVRIRFQRGPNVKSRIKNQRLAVAVAGMLTPGAVMASALGLWRIAADLNWAGTFAIASGPFSHWQFWLGTAVVLQACSSMLNRYGKRGDTAVS